MVVCFKGAHKENCVTLRINQIIVSLSSIKLDKIQRTDNLDTIIKIVRLVTFSIAAMEAALKFVDHITHRMEMLRENASVKTTRSCRKHRSIPESIHK